MVDCHLAAIGAEQRPYMLSLWHAQTEAGQQCKISRHLRRGDALQQLRAGHQALSPISQHAQHQVAVLQRRWAHANGNVNAFRDHIDAPVGFLQVHFDAWVLQHEGCKHVADACIEQSHGAGHANDATRFGVGEGDGFVGRICFDQHRPAMRVVGLAQFGHRKAACGAKHQARAQALLQQRNAAAQLGLGHAQRATRRRKTPVVHHLGEIEKIVQITHGFIVLEIERSGEI
ncbi:hypothetical protein D9M68_654440 [compost metagenome]